MTLFVDMPDDFKTSFTPLLPNLTFKVRVGDSLVQRIGGKTFPVHGHADLPPAIKRQITELKKKKRDFFYNQKHDARLIEQDELNVFRAILDAEIEARREEIRHLRSMPKQDALPGLASAMQEKKQEKASQERIALLQAEIDELQAQKRNLKDDRPFIWSIEFAEIFFDRGGFDIIIGNPPYVRQENITDPNGRLASRDYKEALLEMLRIDFPNYFAKSRAHTDQFRKDRKPSRRSDLYTYFYIRSLRLLNPQGMHVFICSNAWLDVGYGAWLQEFFLRKAPLHFVIDNHAKRSFARADINTVITVASAPVERGEAPDDHVVRFVAFKQPFEDAVLSENLLAIENATAILKTDAFRVFPITVAELLAEGSDDGKYAGDKWGGKYLRAPDIFFTILEKGKGKLVKLGEIAEVRFGIKTGANDFFYLKPLGSGSRPGLLRVRNGAGWEGEIEEEFLKPVVKSPRECRTIIIRPEDLKYRIFMCHRSREELKGTKALGYIEWGEKQGYHLRPSLYSRRWWWDLGIREFPIAVWQKSVNDRHIQSVLPNGHLVDQRLYELTSENQLGEEGFAIILNSVFFWLVKELTGRVNLGEGALDTTVYEAKQTKVLAPQFISSLSISPILRRTVQSVFTECGIDPKPDIPIAEQEPNPLPDRKALDDIVFDALGLTEEERKEVYRAVCQLVWDRISKARSVRRRGQ